MCKPFVDEEQSRAEVEVSVYRQLHNHRCIPKLLAEVREGGDKSRLLAIILEYGGTHSFRVHTVDEAKEYARQLIDGVLTLHQNGIVHRDTKPSNVLVDCTDQGIRVRLIDFDLAVFCKAGAYLNGFCGTRTWMAPEVALCEDDDASYDPRCVDAYGVGVVIRYACITRPEDEVLQKVIDGLTERDPSRRMRLHHAKRLLDEC